MAAQDDNQGRQNRLHDLLYSCESRDEMCVLHTRTPNGYEEWRWLPVREQVVRCKDCAYFDTRKCKSQWPFRLDGFCAWGEWRDA